MELSNILNKIPDAAILVAGDLMLDIFSYGDASRISPEGPVPVLKVERETRMLGGAGNVVTNLAALGVKSYLFALIGHDDNGTEARKIATTLGIDCAGLLEDKSRPTIVKHRFLAQNQQLLRCDFEKTHAVSSDLEEKMSARIEQTLPKVQAVVLSDYGKGVLTRSLIAKIIAAAKAKNIPVLVDPKGADYTLYNGADIVTPNRKELAEATSGMAVKTDDDVVLAAQKLISNAGIENVVATRSEDGMSVIYADKASTPLHLRADAREVFDVSGAGDTVIATIAASVAAGASLQDAAHLANIAGGIAVGKLGTTPVRLDELNLAIDRKETDDRGLTARVCQDWNAAKEIIDVWKAKGLRVGFTNGCFDILHTGHVGYLAKAREKCDRLIVGLNHDVSVKLLKGPTRPVNDEIARANVIGALASVDLVVFFGAQEPGQDNTPSALIGALQPDCFFKGGDYTVESLPEAKIVHSYGGSVEVLNLYEGFSTTSTIEKMKKGA
jgi:D-beta-D-heptose 7-phosphate kinase/D-beta-D-heptose 1-phosphate adenosyltransferase